MITESDVKARIEAAANIQLFLLKKYAVGTPATKDAVMNDVLRLAEYINQQCKCFRRNQAPKTRPAPTSDKTKNSGGMDVSSSHHEVSILSIPPASVEDKVEKGFDRLLSKLLSSPPSTVKCSSQASSPMVASIHLKKVDEKNYSFTFGTPERRTSRSLSSVRNDSSPATHNQMELSSVGRTDEDEDDDDEEVFDLLHSVDDWASLRHFVRSGISTANKGKKDVAQLELSAEHLDGGRNPTPHTPSQSQSPSSPSSPPSSTPPSPSPKPVQFVSPIRPTKQAKSHEDPAVATADLYYDRGRLPFVPVSLDPCANNPVSWGLLGSHKKRQQTRSYSAPNKVDLRKSISLAIQRSQTPT